MNLIDRITNLGRTALQPPGPAGATLYATEQRLAQLDDAIAQAEADAQADLLRRQTADATVAKLTEQAAAGALDDPARLTAALRQQRELAGNLPAAGRLQTLRAEREQLQEAIHAHRRKAAEEAYSAACVAYAQACAPLPALAQRVRDAAEAAGILLNERNSPHLLGRSVQIGGALVDIPAQHGRAAHSIPGNV